MERRYQYQPTSNLYRILVEVDKELLERIDALARELTESRQTLLRRIIEDGLKRERRRLNRQRRALLAQQTALLGSGPSGCQPMPQQGEASLAHTRQPLLTPASGGG